MRNLGINIIKNIDYFQLSKFIDCKNDNPKFKICTPVDMKLIEGNLKLIHINNSVYDEKIYRINNITKLKFPDLLNHYTLLAFHSWNNKEDRKENFNIPQNWNQCIKTYSSIIIQSKTQILTKEMAFLNQFININSIDFKIDNETIITNNNVNIILMLQFGIIKR
ncbi:hypothetical protein [Campylobacter taeniopygiae]|uniref:Uncharacterized protein n=1 Tax=Campylobacter taeniopygiae TaxID=2510188 RepID=A0ABY2TN84_9BACT|nr:hypothetical protein [Campylobacter taeniopygiae]TKX34673.1 hypothetical protein CQA75_00005 [Campylobacter taeniopygiae]